MNKGLAQFHTAILCSRGYAYSDINFSELYADFLSGYMSTHRQLTIITNSKRTSEKCCGGDMKVV